MRSRSHSDAGRCWTAIISMLAASILAVALQAGAALAQTTSDAAAKAAVMRMRDYVVSTPDLDFTTEFTIRSDLSQLDNRGKGHFSIRQPKFFRVSVTSNAGTYDFVSDGATLTILRPKERKYAQLRARGTILATMYLATGLLIMEARLLDFLWTVDFGENVKISELGTETIRGETCRRYAVERFEDRWDVWLRAEPPLPCRLISRRTDGDAKTSQTNEFTWTAHPSFPPDLFSFKPPAGSRKVDVSELQ